MLNNTELHVLTALLMKSVSPDNCKIVIGDKLYDIAGEIFRDVDISLITTAGDSYQIKGLEVKNEARPLDIVHIEQLCGKFGDIPSITKKAIISSSGYTKSAIKKSASKNVELLEFSKVDGDVNLNGMNLSSEDFSLRIFKIVKLNDPLINGITMGNLYYNNICDENGGSPVLGPATDSPLTLNTVRDLINNFVNVQCQNAFMKSEEYCDMKASTLMTFNMTFRMVQPMFIIDGIRRIRLNAVNISGIVTLEENLVPTYSYKIHKVGESEAWIGGIIGEGPKKGLIGFSINTENRNLYFNTIPEADRDKRKVNRREL